MRTNELNKALELQSRRHKSKMGYEFAFDETVWRLDNSLKINFNLLPAIDEKTFLGLKSTLCRYAEEMSASYASTIFTFLLLFFRTTEAKQISLQSITKFNALLDATTEYKLGYLRAFLFSWYDYGFEGGSKEVVDYLEEATLRKNVQGKAVLTKCPYSGAYTPNEQRALVDWAVNAFMEEEISLRAFSILLALLFTGRRPTQIRYLRGSDLIETRIEGRNQRIRYELDIPRLKQRGVKFREVLARIEINEELFQLLSAQAEHSISAVENHFRCKLPTSLKSQVPLYVSKSVLSRLSSIDEFERHLDNDYLHQTSAMFSEIIRSVSRLNCAFSERTADYLHITSRRFRYTKGTNLSRLGISGVALAKALDHSDIQSISVYVENTAEIADQINEIIAPALAPIAQAFAGTLIESERDALRANDPHSRVKNRQSNVVGNCGTEAFCISGYRACYTCIKFQPWRDAPHEEVRDEIIIERAEQKRIGVSGLVVQATDRLLLAVEQVIQMCREAKVGSSDGKQ